MADRRRRGSPFRVGAGDPHWSARIKTETPEEAERREGLSWYKGRFPLEYERRFGDPEDILKHGRTMELAEVPVKGALARQRAGFEFEEPKQAATIGEIGARARGIRAETAGVEHGLEVEKGLRGTHEEIIKQEKRYRGLDIKALERGLKEGRAPEVMPPGLEEEPPTTPAVRREAAKPGRRLRPWIKREVLGGPTALSPLGRAAYGYRNVADWLKYFGRKGLEYAYPGRD